MAPRLTRSEIVGPLGLVAALFGLIVVIVALQLGS
jgi:hypothetical protein